MRWIIWLDGSHADGCAAWTFLPRKKEMLRFAEWADDPQTFGRSHHSGWQFAVLYIAPDWFVLHRFLLPFPFRMSEAPTVLQD